MILKLNFVPVFLYPNPSQIYKKVFLWHIIFLAGKSQHNCKYDFIKVVLLLYALMHTRRAWKWAPLCWALCKDKRPPSFGWDIGSLAKSRESISMGITRHTTEFSETPKMYVKRNQKKNNKKQTKTKGLECKHSQLMVTGKILPIGLLATKPGLFYLLLRNQHDNWNHT